MARKAKVPPADSSGESQTPGTAGSNLTDDVIEINMARVFSTLADLKEAEEAVSQARGVHRAAIKAAKNAGLDPDAIALVKNWKKQEPGEVASVMEKAVRYATVMNLPVGTQLSMFGEAAQKATETPYNAGRFAAANREPVGNNPHTTGSEPWQQWDKGFRDWMWEHAPKAASNGAAEAHA